MVSAADAERAADRVAAAIGNFDGVHKGHRRLIEETVRFAAALGAEPGALVFDPHPRRYFEPDAPPFLISTPERRARDLREAGARRVITLTFDAALAAMTPEAFIRDVLKARLNLAGVVTGTDFRFGKGRAGDAESLRRLCEEAGVAVKLVEPKAEAAGEKIGSSAIREAVAAGDMRAAADMLGRPWSVEGEVVAGEKRGRTIGFPTANLILGDLIEPRYGVYAVRVDADGRRYGGVANFGRRPTVGAPAPLLEVHLFDFSGDLYGGRIEVEFLDFIRDEKKFESLDALKAQIAADGEKARRLVGDGAPA